MKNVNILVLLGIFIVGVVVGIFGTISFMDGEPTTGTAPTSIEEQEQILPVDETEEQEQILPVDEAAVPSQEYNFRKTVWGMDKKSVKASEKGNELVEEDADFLAYIASVSGLDSNVLYSFTKNGQLASGNYIFRNEYTNRNMYIDDYKR